MSGARGTILAKAAALVLAICPQVLVAEGFTGADFAEWSEESQRSYIQTSVTMAGVVASQVKPDISSCIDAWFFASEEAITSQVRSIAATISDYPDYHPSGVILAVIQQNCGAFADD